MAEQPPPHISHVYVSTDTLDDIIRDELYGIQARLGLGSDLPNEIIKEAARTIVKRALLSPR